MNKFAKSLAFVALGASFLTACNTDPCKDVSCGTHGSCTAVDKDAVCNCATGYEKNASGLCETEIRAKFLAAAWAADEDCTNSPQQTYTASISTSTNAVTEVRIGNMWGAFTSAVVGTVAADSTITIARQQPDNDGYYVQGTGRLTSANTITWNYVVTDENDPNNIQTDSCNNVVWTK